MNDPVKPLCDQTGPVMRRLGLPRITPRDARRRRRRRALLRVLMCLAVTGAVALVAAVGRRAAPMAPDPTIPSAIHHDLQQYERKIVRTVSSIRSLSLPPGEVVEQ